jgi:hypothetical protein
MLHEVTGERVSGQVRMNPLSNPYRLTELDDVAVDISIH